jgi:hypothetical protein
MKNENKSAEIIGAKKLTLKELNGEMVLHQNDTPAKCAFVNPFPMPHPITGRVDFVTPICSTSCQFFTLIQYSDNVTGDKTQAVYFDCVGCSKTLTP